jgi:hypothetical protein
LQQNPDSSMNGLLGAQFAILETTSGRNGLTWSSSGGAARTALEAGWVLAAITTVRPELEGVTLRGPVWRSASSTIFLAEGEASGPHRRQDLLRAGPALPVRSGRAPAARGTGAR